MYPDERANRNATVGDFFESMHSEEHERNVKMRIFRHESNFPSSFPRRGDDDENLVGFPLRQMTHPASPS